MVGVPFLAEMRLRAVVADRLALALPQPQMSMIHGPNRKTNSSAVTMAPPVRNVM